MINDLRRPSAVRMWKWAVAAAVLLGAVFLGYRASWRWLALLVASLGAIILLQWPALGILALVPAALVVPLEFSTGTEVDLNLVTLLVPALIPLAFLDVVRRRGLRFVRSRTTGLLLLFLLAGLLSLLVGNALWDPAVPRSRGFVLVQLAQWGILALSAGAFWLNGTLMRDEVWLRRLTFSFLAIAGGLALLLVLTADSRFYVRQVATTAMTRSPYWMLLAALCGGQLLFNERLSIGWRLFFLATAGAVLFYAFYLERETVSHWVGVAAVAGVLAWLRWPRLRYVALALLLVLVSTGFLSSTIYDFAGGRAEWEESGGSRLALIQRVIDVSLRNPITGLGPAAYRAYARMEPLQYGRAFWVNPNVSSHNNYVDLFAHTGLVGLGLFIWFAIEIVRLGYRLRTRYAGGFAAGYVNAMIAAWAGALVLMMLADWVLPFVYNIGFPGFQASVLVWLFLGGLVALENAPEPESV